MEYDPSNSSYIKESPPQHNVFDLHNQNGPEKEQLKLRKFLSTLYLIMKLIVTFYWEENQFLNASQESNPYKMATSLTFS